MSAQSSAWALFSGWQERGLLITAEGGSRRWSRFQSYSSLTQLCHQPAGGTVSKRLPPQAPTLCSRPLTAGKAGRGNERFLGTSCSPSWHCATVFPKIVIKILSQPCYLGAAFVMLMLQTRRQAQKSAGPTVANEGQGRDVNPGPKASAPTGTTHGAGDRPGPASCPVLYVSDVGDSGERGTEWRQRREGRDACGAAQGLLIEGRCWSVLPSSCLWAVTS